MNTYTAGLSPSVLNITPPFDLLAHIAQHFRPLVEGERPHRLDFTREMLEGGWRPLMEGESYFAGDEYFDEGTWKKETARHEMTSRSTCFPTRVRRPLPLLDPYAKLKAAHKAGKVIEVRHALGDGGWTVWGETKTPYWLEGDNTQYRIKHEPDADGWIPHDGGACPVDGETMVEIKYRRTKDQKVFIDKSSHWKACWKHSGHPNDIIAYRPVPEPKMVPWTRETCPPLPFEVVVKETKGRFLACGAVTEGCYVINDLELWEQMLADYTLRDGSPCGTPEDVK